MPNVKVSIDPLGNPTIEAIGFTGGACKAATKALEDAFAGGQMNVVEKPEMHYAETDEQTHEHTHN
jgi:hypothetical protein